MNKQVLITLFFLLITSFLQGQNVEGIWVTTDDKSGQERSHVEIYREDGELRGRITKLLLAEAADICSECKGDKKDKPLIGLDILSSMAGSGGKYKGRILDPEDGRVYRCKLTLVEDDKIKLRGYIGTPMLGRTQYWRRLK